MSDQPGYQVPRSAAPDPIPLLPRGAVLFEEIPLKAVVMDALAPSLGHGTLVVRDRDRGAVVLVRDGALVEVHAFSASSSRSGDGVLAEVQGWSEAVVWAHRLDAVLVDVCEALLRGEIIYTDLRLDWVEWPSLLADFARRGGAFAVEVFTPAGRGVTCVAVGQQALSYTDLHPSLGDPAMLEAMASGRDGSIRVRRLNAAAFAATALGTAGQPAGVQPAAATPATAAPGVGAPGVATASEPQPRTAGDRGNGSARTDPRAAATAARDVAETTLAPIPSVPEPQSTPLAGEQVLPDLTWIAPWQTPWREEEAPTTDPSAGAQPGGAAATPGPPVGAVLDALRSISQRRLQRSSSRVEAVLDDAAREQRSVDSVLEEIRAMSIRGVMPSTLDAMVIEMSAAAAQHRST